MRFELQILYMSVRIPITKFHNIAIPQQLCLLRFYQDLVRQTEALGPHRKCEAILLKYGTMQSSLAI